MTGSIFNSVLKFINYWWVKLSRQKLFYIRNSWCAKKSLCIFYVVFHLLKQFILLKIHDYLFRYFRYLMVTEIYMMERWERISIRESSSSPDHYWISSQLIREDIIKMTYFFRCISVPAVHVPMDGKLWCCSAIHCEDSWHTVTAGCWRFKIVFNLLVFYRSDLILTTYL